MKTAGITAEYNPYHNGHRYLTEQLRERGATHLVAVLSGHLVQRGEPAFFSKWTRTEMALACGVDLVVELPSLYAVSSAERFAAAAVSLLDGMGCVNVLGFGSECGDTGMLLRAAEAVDAPETEARLREELRKGGSFPAARQRAVAQTAGDGVAAVLAEPNDILGVEYCRSLRRRSSAIRPTAVRRVGSEHDADVTDGCFASASFLREGFLAGEDLSPYLPEPVGAIALAALKSKAAPCRLEALEELLLYELRRASVETLSRLPDVSEGLESRLARAAVEAQSLEEFYALAKTKRYTHSRLRRIALYAALGVTKEDLLLPPPYLRVLGMNERGREILAQMKQTATLPYGTSLAKLARESASAARVAELELRAGDLFGLGLPKRQPGGLDYTREAVLR